MTPAPAALARATKSGSTFLKQNSEIAGTFIRNISACVPDGEMSSVDTLSPSLMTTDATSVSGTGVPRGTSLMFGPLKTSTVTASSPGIGGTRPATDAARDGG